MLKDFKEFALKGNIIDLAVAVIIGGAFGRIVSSLVNDIIMPLLSLLIGGVNFTNLFLSLDGIKYPTLSAAKEAGAVVISYGIFLGYVFDFLIISFSIFLVIRYASKLSRKEKVIDEILTKDCDFCKTVIPLDATRCPNCTSELV